MSARGARAIRAGTVTVNSFGEGDISTPFGGFKASGFGGRDNVPSEEVANILRAAMAD